MLKIPASIIALPTRVYITYLIDEYSFLPPPQTEMRKYIGISSSSQNKKKRTMSKEQKTPSMLASRSNNQMKYSLGLNWIFHDTSTAKTPRNVISITRGKLRPSTPRWQKALIAAIQESFSS